MMRIMKMMRRKMTGRMLSGEEGEMALAGL